MKQKDNRRKTMLTPPRSQQAGVTLIGMLLLGALMVFWVLSIVKLTPVYIEGYSVRSIFTAFEEAATDKPMTKREIKSYFEKAFDVNTIQARLPDNRPILYGLVIEPKKKVVAVSLNYQIETPMLANLYFTVKFDNAVEVPKFVDSGS